VLSRAAPGEKVVITRAGRSPPSRFHKSHNNIQPDLLIIIVSAAFYGNVITVLCVYNNIMI